MTTPTSSHPAVWAPSASVEMAQGDPERRRLEAAVREFEGIFLAQMFRSTLGREGESASSPGAAGPWGDMLWDAYGRAVARAGGIGLADVVLRSLVEQRGEAG